ncbi:unnamed protein product, partial [Amoebophrya sp. A120]
LKVFRTSEHPPPGREFMAPRSVWIVAAGDVIQWGGVKSLLAGALVGSPAPVGVGSSCAQSAQPGCPRNAT